MNNPDSKTRLGRVLWDFGYFVRIGVPFSPSNHFVDQRRPDIVDVDVLGIRFDVDFTPQFAVGQVSVGTDKVLDSILRLGGLMRALKARTGFLITDRETQTYRNVAKPLGISVLSERQLQGLETKAIFPKKLFGSFDPFLASKVADFKQDVRRKFRSQLNYLIYRYWVEPYYSQIKRLISIAKTLRPYDGSTAFQWMIGETMIRFVVSLCHLCNELYLVPEEELKAEVSTQLFGGVIQRREREELRATIANLISQLSQPSQKRLHPEDELSLDPEYIPALTEVAWRVTNQSRITRQLPRFADLMWYEFVLKDKPVSEAGMADFFSEREFSILSKILRDIIEFLTRNAGMDARLFETMFA